MNGVQLFLSHSERDEQLVRPLAGWLQLGLGLNDDQIRCTVVPSTNMDVGSIPAEALRQDLVSAKAVIGLLTANSLRSSWVQLEMGAAWLQERLRPIRGPGIRVADLPSPLSEFNTVGYCEQERMHWLLHQLGDLIGVRPDPEAEQELVNIAASARKTLAEETIDWFSLPPLLSVQQIKPDPYTYEFLKLCRNLGLDERDLDTCTTPQGFLIRDPDQLPIWARKLWTVSKDVVNAMLSGSSRKTMPRVHVPNDVLSDILVHEMRNALNARNDRAALIQKWFKHARDWIRENPPMDHPAHSPSGHGAGVPV